MQAASDDAVVTLIDLTTKRLIDTGIHIPRFIQQISPDRILLYTYVADNKSPYHLTIYVFDPNTGAVHPGGTIKVPAQYSLVSAVRK